MGTWYTVQPGDTLSKIARANGFGDWRTITRVQENGNFADRPESIGPGDRIYIPDLKAKALSSTSGRLHPFKQRKPRADPGPEDLIPKARRLHKEYLDARDEFVKWNVDPAV